jgi:putative radical SAM enzyme (TIGR03279 family)
MRCGGGDPVALGTVSSPLVTAVAPGSAAELAGLCVGDEITAINGVVPADVLEYRWLVDEADPELDVVRGGVAFTVVVPKGAGQTLGVEVHSAVFDRVMTCDNHCEFCFIYQLPPGTRRSLHLKDDDYRLSFLYGNFTTLTRFTELDFERVVSEGLTPLHVSIHTTDPPRRAEMLRNRRGAVSLRWLRALLDAGVEVHGQVVVCPGVNDAAVLVDTLTGVLDEYPELASVCVVPLGVSQFNREARMRAHTVDEAAAVVDAVHAAQADFLAAVGRRVVFAADEYYLLSGRPFPDPDAYEGFAMHEDGVGMAASFALEFAGAVDARPAAHGFFAAVDGAPADGYRARRNPAATPQCSGSASASASADAGAGGSVAVAIGARRGAPVTVVTGTYGAAVLRPILDAAGYADTEVLAVPNVFFGGTTAVTGLLTGADLSAALAGRDPTRRYLLPDVCLSSGRFLDDTTVADLPVHVEVIPTDGASLRAALDGSVVS